ASTQFLYGGAARRFSSSIVRTDQVLSGSMRAPGEAVGMLALEGAMDELADKLRPDAGISRTRNILERHPAPALPYSAGSPAECLDAGAAEFGWSVRNRRPASRREGEWWIGMGMAAAARSNLLVKSSARVTLKPDGRACVETDMTDIGTGSYTILAQIAAELL